MDRGSETEGVDGVILQEATHLVPLELNIDESSNLSALDAGSVPTLPVAKEKLGKLIAERKKMKQVLRSYYATDDSLLCDPEQENLDQENSLPSWNVQKKKTLAKGIVHRVYVLCRTEASEKVLVKCVSNKEGGYSALGGAELAFGEELFVSAARQVGEILGTPCNSCAVFTVKDRIDKVKDEHTIETYIQTWINPDGNVLNKDYVWMEKEKLDL
uniref:Uncharacterized protein n=1 Tax=Mucochytrium quahogii TaxID=96639 RepID=A0A7S2RAY6_9STRA|mmetsp:Transcript_4937/g.7484  ORF Transcript_4937/g.7484 Transcript_4937/m.7484 type:complete len:215 (-) Transcript_4937:94-738(-)|eukprot:CAMPEP_0203760974 /NCGR_PEP_ID=MMETSP0098-20131031/14156_1 /ASSEMBLY_ACC=CAM_ASM_000208 /TAXON_ID=96639 /ORGANISM=" , Strain NY0313808BC1" /LENGTH=214 /DNA_ID=CAMNT_0050654761 /DNA_START=200 /DNA_END=844 /DNA_ORIENTATION=+